MDKIIKNMDVDKAITVHILEISAIEKRRSKITFII